MANVVTTLAVFAAVACGQNVPQRSPSETPNATFQLDSTEQAEKASFDSMLRATSQSSPGELDTLRKVWILSTHMRLARLGYVSGPFDTEVTAGLREALDRYQRDRGIAPDSNPISFDVMTALNRDEAELDVAPRAPSLFVTSFAGYAQASGSWVFDGQGDQHNAAQIECHQSAMECIESQAILSGIFGNGQQLTTDLQRWTIASWDNAEIVTKPVDFRCTRYVLRINLIQKTATKIRSTISSTAECAPLERRDLVIHLRDGPDLLSDRAGRPLSEFMKLTPRATAFVEKKR